MRRERHLVCRELADALELRAGALQRRRRIPDEICHRGAVNSLVDPERVRDRSEVLAWRSGVDGCERRTLSLELQPPLHRCRPVRAEKVALLLREFREDLLVLGVGDVDVGAKLLERSSPDVWLASLPTYAGTTVARRRGGIGRRNENPDAPRG